VVPEKDAAGVTIDDPIGLVQREKQMKLLSAVIISLSAISLYVVYRPRLIEMRAAQRSNSTSERRTAKA
jgi:hypothetical protein